MRIAMIAPLWKPVPPKKYGGTELITSLLTESLVTLGHQVTLYACNGSKTTGNLKVMLDEPLYDKLGRFDFTAIQHQDLMVIKQVFDDALAGKFDIIHNHMGLHLAALSNVSPVPMVTTNHSSVAPDFEPLSKQASQANYVSISNAQRQLAPYLNYVATVYHGIDTQQFEFNLVPDDYLLYLATISPEKGADLAIKIAQQSQKRLIMAGDIRNQKYFDEAIKPYCDGKQIQYLGEVDFPTKNKLMKNALAYLFPIRWQEAFGLTMIEALASATPVIAYPKGSVLEIIDDKKTGFIVNNVSEAVDAINKIVTISREKCREVAVARFDRFIMAQQYLDVYQKILR